MTEIVFKKKATLGWLFLFQTLIYELVY